MFVFQDELQDQVNKLKEDLNFEQMQSKKLRSGKDILAARCHEFMVSSLENQEKIPSIMLICLCVVHLKINSVLS